MTTGGVVSASDIVSLPGTPNQNGLAGVITAGPDGNLWLSHNGAVDKVAPIVTTTSQIAEYPFSGGAQDLLAGPDNRIWLTSGPGGTAQIGAMATDGTPTTYPHSSWMAGTWGITVGPDNNLWVGLGHAIAVVDTTGAVVHTYPMPSASDSNIRSLVLGPDGNVWFTLGNTPAGPGGIGKITPTGAVTVFTAPISTVPGQGSQPWGLAVGPDSRIWYVDPNNDWIGAFATTATSAADVTTYPTNHSNTGLLYITRGSDGRMWFGESNRDALGAITAGGSPPPQTFNVSVVKPGSGSGTVTSTPAGIACGSTCSAGFTSGAQVTMTAVASAGSTFAGWSGGGCSGSGSCTVTVSADTTLSATFNQMPRASTTATTATSTTTTTTNTTTSSPPPPILPRVTRIDSLAPPIAGSPVVLRAVTDGPVTSIAWNLAGDSRPEITCAGAQTAVTFRASAGATSVSATALGTGGTGLPLTSSIVVAPAASMSAAQRRITQRVEGVLARHAPVYTCAAAKDFTVKQVGTHPVVFDHTVTESCPPSRTVVAGGLQFEGCLEHLTSEGQIPQAMQGMLPSFGSHLKLGSRFLTNSSAANADLTFGFIDAYIAYDPVKVNGLTLIPAAGAAIVIAPQLDEIVSSDAQMAVGNVDLQNNRSFIMNLAAHGDSIPLGSFARAGGGLADIAGFALGGDVNVALDDSGGTFGLTIHVHLSLPSFLQVGGVSVQGDVTLRSTNADGLVLDNLRIGPIDADLGALSVKAVQLDYTRATDEWRGQGKACVIEDICLEMVPPRGEVIIRRGSLVKLEASLPFPDPGLELFAGVALNRIGFGFGLDPTRLLANAQITAETILQINGTVVLAFPSAATPYVLDRSEVPDFPDNFYGRTFPRTTIAVGADASIVLPVLGTTPLAQAYLLYEYPGYFALGGGFHANLFDVIDVSGRIDGEFNGDNGRFNLKGDIHGCVVDVVCAGVVAVISSRGLGGCLTIPFPTGDLNVGGGVQYSPFHLFLWPFDGCRWSPFVQADVFSPQAARAAAAGSPITVRIKRGDRSRAIRLDGVDGAPSVRVRTPSGDMLESTPQSGLAHDQAIRILRGEKAKITVVGLVNPNPGTYTIELLPGSPAVKVMSQASDQPRARISASVRGKGARKTLVYSVARRIAQRVTFVEQTHGGARTIGTVTGGGRGQISFTPAPGFDERTVVAEFELAGLPAERLTVAHFAPVSPRLGRPARLRVARRGLALKLSWRSVPGASRYEVVARLNSGGERVVRTRRAGLTLQRVARYDGGRISVRAVATLRLGRPAVSTVRPAGRMPTRLGPLPRPPR